MNLQCEQQKVKREIERHGNFYTCFRTKTDKYGEPLEESEKVAEFKGLYHAEKSYSTRTVNDGTNTRTKGQPMLLCLFEDAEKINNGDYFIINGKKFIVSDKNNMFESNILVNLSLELVLNGNI